MIPVRLFESFLITLVALGGGFRIWLCFHHNPLNYLFSDPERHWINASSFFSPNMMGAGDPIAYQVFLSGVRLLTRDHTVLIALVNALLSVLTPWLFYKACREFGFSRLRSRGVWALITWTPSLFVIFHYLMMETIMLPLIALGLWMTGRYLRKGTTQNLLFATVCWTVAVLSKSTVVPLAAICLAYVWVQKSRKIKDVILCLLAVVLLMIPNALRSQQTLGFYAPLGNPWIAKIMHRSDFRWIDIDFAGREPWRFASPSGNLPPLEPLSLWRIRRGPEETCVYVKINPENGQRDWVESFEQLNPGWKNIALQHWENIILFLFSPSWPDSYQGEWDGMLNHRCRWMWFPIVYLICVFNLQAFLNKRFHIISVATSFYLLFFLLQNVATIEGRYRKPIEPLLLMNIIFVIQLPKTKFREVGLKRQKSSAP